MLCSLRSFGSFNNSAEQSKDWLGLLLIIISSVLVGIWAVKGTIALRNILLAVGSVSSIMYCYHFFKFNTQKIPLRHWALLILVGLIFCWVLIHYFMYSVHPDQQWKELKSTWLRVVLGAITAFGTSLSLLKNKYSNYLVVGLAAPFIVIGAQYTELVWETGNIFQPNVGQYIFLGKINAVLIGSILIAILLAYLFENIGIKKSLKINPKIIIALVLFFFVQYCFVFIFDTRSGVAISLIQLLLCILFYFRFILKGVADKKKCFWVICLLIGFIYLSANQLRYNFGWPHFIEDINVSSKIHENKQWINPDKYGYPLADKVRVVAHNTYVRIAWFLVGSNFLLENPLGNGVLYSSFGKELEKRYPENSKEISAPVSTHSALLEYGLAFGWPFLILITLLFISIIINAKYLIGISPHYVYQILFSLFIVYAIGELSSGHGIEIFIFSLVSIAGLEIGDNLSNINLSILNKSYKALDSQ